MIEDATVIFDNAGGVILKLKAGGKVYCHYYSNPKMAAIDFNLFETTDYVDLDDWEGHEEGLEGWEPHYEDIRNGSHKIFRDYQIEAQVSEDINYWGYNHESFIEELRKIF